MEQQNSTEGSANHLPSVASPLSKHFLLALHQMDPSGKARGRRATERANHPGYLLVIIQVTNSHTHNMHPAARPLSEKTERM